MTYQTFERVVLNRDLPEKGLRHGDIGVVVEVLDDGGLALEIFNALGETSAVTMVSAADVQRPFEEDMLAVREATGRS